MRKPSLVLLAAVAVLALALVSGAQASSLLVIRGAGFGHGIGMSQYGAYGYALHGQDYRFILGHYYTGTSLASLDSNPDVRVLLQAGRASAVITGAQTAGGQPLDVTKTYTVTQGGDGLVVKDGDKALFTSVPPMRLEAPAGGTVLLKGTSTPAVRDGLYRGAIEVRPSGSGVNAINALDLEDYVRGVVSGESPSTWPAEALKAQAVAARSYAVTTSKGGDGFDQYADERSQVYKGALAEFPSTDAAVAATRGEVVTFLGRPVTTYFFSTSGGRTENIENSFVGSQPQPWLKGVDDPYDTESPKHVWATPIRLTMKQAKKALGRLVLGRFKRIKVLQRGTSPRVVRAVVVGTKGTAGVTGPQLRSAFGLWDTWAYFTTVSSSVQKPSTPPASNTPAPPAPSAPSAPSTGGASPDGARAAAAVARRAAVISGRFEPARPGTWAKLELRDGATWRTAADLTIASGGRYSVRAPGPGVYRVVLGPVAGPDVRVG
jgi:stage II sporulation protein D